MPATSPSAPTALARVGVLLAVLPLLVSLATSAGAQSGSGGAPFPNWNPYGTSTPPSSPPGGSASTTPTAPARPPATRPAPAAPTSPVLARVGGRAVTQADFDRVAQPYFQRLRRELGGGFNADVQKMAALNVMDELIRREVLAIEAQRQGLTATTAEVDSLIAQDPLFQTNGRFDAAKFNAYKTSPGSNYLQVLPRLREAAAQSKLDASLRRRFTPTPAQVREEWNRRNEQVRMSTFPLLLRDVSTEPEATEAEWAEYYRAHSEQFQRRAQVRLRWVRLPLPEESDTTRAAETARLLDVGRAIADSLRRGTLADTGARFLDTGLFDVPTAMVPGLGRLAELADTLARAEQDSTIRVVGPYTGRDFVAVGVVADRRGRHVPPMREVLADVRRRADAEKRRATADADRRAFWAAHLDRWRTTRVSLTRVNVDARTRRVKPPSTAEIDRWYAQYGRTLSGAADSSRASIPPITDSLRAVVGERMLDERRRAATDDVLARVSPALASGGDARALARANGGVAETLSVYGGGPADSLFSRAFLDSLLAPGAARRGVVLGPRSFGPYASVWRVDAVDTAYVPPYEFARARSDQQFAEDRRRLDDADGRAWFDAHRGDYRAPEKFACDVISVRVPPADSVALTDAELRRWYDANPATYRQEEQVRARHILFMTRGQGADVDARAKTRADSLLAAIRKDGGDFAELARRFSEEPGAATRGGDLGWFGRGRMVPEFETAAFALKPGEISAVVKTQFGYHLIRVEDHRPAGLKPFDEVKADIRLQLGLARGDSTARRDADALRRKLAAGGDAGALAVPYGGVVALEPVAAADPLPGIGPVADLAKDLSGIVPGRWATRTYRAGNQYVLVRLREKQAARPAEFEEVRARAVEDAKAARKRQALDGKVAAIRAALAAGASLDSLAAPWGGLKDSGPLVAGTAYVPPVGNEPRLVETAFRMRPGQVSDTLQVEQGVAWVRLEEKKTPDAEVFRAAAPTIEAEILRRRFDEWVAERRKTIPVQVLRADLRRPAAPAGLTTR